MLKGSSWAADGCGGVENGSTGRVEDGAARAVTPKGSCKEGLALLPGPSKRAAQSSDCSFFTGCLLGSDPGTSPKAPQLDDS